MSTAASATQLKERVLEAGVNGAVSRGRVLPPGLNEITFDEACDAVAKVIGEENLSRTYEHGALEGPYGEKWYGDHYEMRGAGRNTPSGAFRPATVEELQAIFKIANEYNIPLWVFSRGKNLGSVKSNFPIREWRAYWKTTDMAARVASLKAQWRWICAE